MKISLIGYFFYFFLKKSKCSFFVVFVPASHGCTMSDWLLTHWLSNDHNAILCPPASSSQQFIKEVCSDKRYQFPASVIVLDCWSHMLEGCDKIRKGISRMKEEWHKEGGWEILRFLFGSYIEMICNLVVSLCFD